MIVVIMVVTLIVMIISKISVIVIVEKSYKVQPADYFGTASACRLPGSWSLLWIPLLYNL